MTIHEAFPYLRVAGAAKVIDFDVRAFGAVDQFRLTEPSGRIGHAQLTLGPITLMLSVAYPEFDLLAPTSGKVDGASIHLHVDDGDALAANAVACSATLEMPPSDQFYGERSCKVRDPFGHQWLLGHEIEKVEVAEMQRRYDEMMAKGGW